MSYSDVSNMIEEKGFKETFEELYKEYRRSKSELKLTEEAYMKARGNFDHDLSQSGWFVKVAISRGIAEMEEDGPYVVRHVIGDEIVTFKLYPDSKYAISYEQLTPLP